MLRLSNVLFATLLFATTLSMSSCSFSASPINSIPADAAMVATMDVKQLMEKADYEAIKQMDFYKEMLTEVEREAPEALAFLQDPKEAGISLDGNFSFFLKINPDDFKGEPMIAAMLPISDVAKVEGLMNKAREKNPNMPKAESKSGYQVLPLDGESKLAWSSTLLAITNIKGDEELGKLFSPDKDNSIHNNKSFEKHLKEKKDAMLWMTSDPIAKAILDSEHSRDISGFMMLMQLSNKVLQDNSISAYYNFEKGAIEAGAHFDFNEKLREEFGIAVKDKIETDFTKYMPAEGLMSMGALGLDLSGIESILTKRMLHMPTNAILGNVGLSLGTLVKGLDGELAFATYADTSSVLGQSVIFALGLKDKSLVDKVIKLAQSTGANVEKKGNRLTITPPAMVDPIDPSMRADIEKYGGMEGLEDLGSLGMFKVEAVITDDALVFSTKAGVLDKIAAGGYTGSEAANNEYIKEALSGWTGAYYNYGAFLDGMANMPTGGTPGLLSMGMNPMSSIMIKMMAKYNEFTHAVTVFKGHDTYGKVYLKTTDKNSLKRMLEIADDVYKNREELMKEFGKAMIEEEMMEGFEEMIKEESEKEEKDINL